MRVGSGPIQTHPHSGLGGLGLGLWVGSATLHRLHSKLEPISLLCLLLSLNIGAGAEVVNSIFVSSILIWYI